MTEPVTDPAPAAEPQQPAKPSLEDSLAALDEQTRAFVLGEVKSAREEAKNLRGRLKDAEPIVQQWQALEEASKTELQRAQEELAREQSARMDWQKRAVSSRIETLAADAGFADPSDALSAIDPGGFLGAGGEFDDQGIRTALGEVLERKPHWRKPADTGPAAPRVPVPNPAQGAGANGAAPVDPATQFAALIQQQLHNRS